MNEQDNEEFIELAGVSDIKSYQRRTQSGKVVTVRGYVRTDNSAVADRAKASPGRPGTASTGGRFPSDRSLPLFPDAGKTFKEKEAASTKVEYEGLPNTGVVDQDALDKEVPIALEILPNLPTNPAMKKLISILRGLTTVSLSEDPSFDPEILELAKRGIVRVKGYSYVSKKTGKLVRVNPYTQVRALVSALGGPDMAARKGITPDLIDKAMPGWDIKNKAFKEKVPDVKPTRAQTRRSKASVAKELNEIQVDRTFDVPAPKPGENFMVKAMSPSNPLAAVRNAKEGSTVSRDNDTWVRGMDNKWYKTPRRTVNGIDDKELTKRIASKGGRVKLTQGDPVVRKDFVDSKVNYDILNPNSVNYSQSVRYSKALEAVYRNFPEGVADSLTGNLEVRRQSGDKDKDYTSMTKVTSTRANNHYPKMVVNPNPAFEKDIIKAVPKQQQAGFLVPSTLHPLETVMARESANFTEKLIEVRAPNQMTERMYDRMSAAYDKHIKNDDGDYSGLSGKEGWIARLTGDRSDELKQEIQEKLSMSALESPEDFLAESWTEFVGNPSPRALSRAVAEEFQNTMVEFSDYLFKNNWADATEIPEKTFERTTKKSAARKVSDVIGGSEANIVETNMAPRDLRSVLRSESKYLDIRDDNGNPMFDAHIQRDGDTANISSLNFPLAKTTQQPTGVPKVNPDYFRVEEEALYFETPEDLLKGGKANQRRYADFIDQERALLAIEAVEETMFSEGVRRFEIDTKPGEDSVLYARAGYIFDPNDTDVYEIQTILNDIRDSLDGNVALIRDSYFPIPKSQQRSIRTKINKLDREMTADPATWPTPQEIAQLGKTSLTKRSIGEAALEGHSWAGVKTLDGDKYTKVGEVSLEGSYEDLAKQDYKKSIIASRPSASAISKAARAISERKAREVSLDVKDAKQAVPDTSTATAAPKKPTMSEDEKKSMALLHEALTDLSLDVLSRHQDTFADAKVIVKGPLDEHSILIKDKNGRTAFRIGIEKNPNGDFIWTGPTFDKDNMNSAFLAFDMTDELEMSYKQSDVKFLWKYPEKKDAVANYALSAAGFNWATPPSREELSTIFEMERRTLTDEARRVYEMEAVAKTKDGSIEDMVKAQGYVDSKVQQFNDNLEARMNTYLDIFDNDPSGLTPFEVGMIAKKEARELRKQAAIASGKIQPSSNQKQVNNNNLPGVATGQGTGNNSSTSTGSSSSSSSKSSSSTSGGSGLPKVQGEGTPDERPKTKLDTYPEFIAKQMATFGAYGMYKSMSGYWDWASNVYNPSARKSSVALLFMLLRLLPASVARGALMGTVNTMVKRIRSPRPDDWPSPSEIRELVEEVQNKTAGQTNGTTP